MARRADPRSVFTAGFAAFYDRYGTRWTTEFADLLVRHLALEGRGPGRALDLACGSGVAALALQRAGWHVLGIDASEAMLEFAAARLADGLASGTVELRQSALEELEPPPPVDLCIALEGPLNYLASNAALEQTFQLVGRSLVAGGTFVFDLYEPAHFRRWHDVTVMEEPDAFVVRRGVWDEVAQRGMLRVSGAFGVEPSVTRIAQTVTSRSFRSADVVEALTSAGFEEMPVAIDVPACVCGSSDPTACRTVHIATRTAHVQPD